MIRWQQRLKKVDNKPFLYDVITFISNYFYSAFHRFINRKSDYLQLVNMPKIFGCDYFDEPKVRKSKQSNHLSIRLNFNQKVKLNIQTAQVSAQR